MSDIPDDIMRTARSAADSVSFGGYEANTLAIARLLLAERKRCADIILHDCNRKLDSYYCCSAIEQGVQICGCQAVSIRDELVSQIESGALGISGIPPDIMETA